MARNSNQDYFKTGGGAAGSGASASGRFAVDRVRLTSEHARLRREASKLGQHPPARTPAPSPPPKAAAKPLAKTAAKAKAAAKVKAPARPMPVPKPIAAPRAPQPVALVRELHSDRVKHGKKRRSSKKRHEVAVLHERHEHLAHHAGVAEQVRVAVPPKPGERAEDHGPTTAPPSLRHLGSRALEHGKQVALLAAELVSVPFTIARLLGRERKKA